MASELIFKSASYAMPIILGIWLLFFVGLGTVLIYHWRRYGVERDRSSRFQILYITVGALLLGLMTVSYFMFLAA